ncbi:hypothetical protein FJY94_04215 [Candidatus Kaiserbacteria bacterium]|nr:hypothetical protein [Candidatus Kaiserbacteria bacterium]
MDSATTTIAVAAIHATYSLQDYANIATIIAAASQAVLVLGLVSNWRQISISISNNRIRSLREARAFALSQATVFADIINAYDVVSPRLVNEQTRITHRFSSLSYRELTAEQLPIYAALVKAIESDRQFMGQIIALANRIEAFSMTFTKGMADEEVVYDSVSQTYCEIVEAFFFIYCFLGEMGTAYPNTKELYKVWKNRRDSQSLETEIKDLENKKSANLLTLCRRA